MNTSTILDITRVTAALIGRLSARKLGAPDEEILRAIALYASPQLELAALEAIKQISSTRELYVRGWLQLLANQDNGENRVLSVCRALGYEAELDIDYPESCIAKSSDEVRAVLDEWDKLLKLKKSTPNATKGDRFEKWVRQFMLASSFFDRALPQFKTFGTSRRHDFLLRIARPPLPGWWKNGEPLGFCLVEAKDYGIPLVSSDTDSFSKYVSRARKTNLCKIGFLIAHGSYNKKDIGHSVAGEKAGDFFPALLDAKEIVGWLRGGYSPDEIIQLGFLHMADAA